MKKSEALALIEAIKILRDNADDKTASAAAQLYPPMKRDGSLVKAGSRVNIEGHIYRAKQDVYDCESNDPTFFPEAWERIEYKEGYREIPENITSEKSFSLGERGWWKKELMESLEDSNISNPEKYSKGWKKVDKKELNK